MSKTMSSPAPERPQTPTADTGPTLLQVLQRPNPPITDQWAGKTYKNTRSPGDNHDTVHLDDQHPSVQEWTDFTFSAIQLAYGHLLDQKMRALWATYRPPLTPSPGQRLGRIVSKSSVNDLGIDWMSRIVRAPIEAAGQELRPLVSALANTSTEATFLNGHITWDVPRKRDATMKPDWAAVDTAVEVVYEEANVKDRKPKWLVYALGNNSLSQKWKSKWLALPSGSKVQMDPSLSDMNAPVPCPDIERVIPLNRIATYCRYAETRYGFILTQHELVALRIRRIPRPQVAAARADKLHAAVEYASVPLTASTGLTANLAIWALACMGMNDQHRAMESAQNAPVDSMARLTWWVPRADATGIFYENVISKRQIREENWKSEYADFVHLADTDGLSFTKDFLSAATPPLPKGSVSAVTAQAKVIQPATAEVVNLLTNVMAMDTTRSLSDPPEPLPRLPGPRLAPFTPTAYTDIEFVEELGNPAVDMDSFVWKVRINGTDQKYVLKMFRFNSASWLRKTVGSYLNRPLASPQLYIDYFDPFNCECRTYGRLEQEGRPDLAIRAHGYLLLTPEQQKEVAERSGPIDPDDPDDYLDPWGRVDEPLVSDRPVHAIVKDFADDEEYFGPDQVGNLFDDLEGFHELGILVRDIKINNYIGGKLVDLSRAWTMPHPSLEHIHPTQLQGQRQRDPDALLGCIVDLGMAEGWDWDEVETPPELEACAFGESENDRYGANPQLYDWRRWEDDLEAVDLFLEHWLYAPSESEAEGDGAEV